MSTMAFSGGRLVTEPRVGAITGTVVAKVTDNENRVASVEFHVRLLTGGEGESLGIYPPDITRRPGWYEKDEVLHSLHQMEVKTILRDDAGGILASAVDTLATRAPSAGAGGGTTLLVQDEDTQAREATKLLFQGSVVEVDPTTKVATLNLDGRYAQFSHGHSFASLSALPTTLAGYGITDALLNTDANVARYNAPAKFAGSLGITGWNGQLTWDDRANAAANQFLIYHNTQILRVWHPAGGDRVTINTAGDIGSTGNITAGGAVLSQAGQFTGLTGLAGPYLSLAGANASLLTNGAALHLNAKSLLLSDNYSETMGEDRLRVFGRMQATAGFFSATSGNVFLYTNCNTWWQAQQSNGSYEYFLWPRADDNNTYLNFGSGGHFYIRDNASIVRGDFSTGGLRVTGNVVASADLYAGPTGGGLVIATWLFAKANGGLYGADHGGHLYNGVSYWNVTPMNANPGAPGFCFRSGHANTVLGYVVATSLGVSLYGPDGSLEAVRATNDGVRLSGIVYDEFSTLFARVQIRKNAPSTSEAGAVGTLYCVTA